MFSFVHRCQKLRHLLEKEASDLEGRFDMSKLKLISTYSFRQKIMKASSQIICGERVIDLIKGMQAISLACKHEKIFMRSVEEFKAFASLFDKRFFNGYDLINLKIIIDVIEEHLEKVSVINEAFFNQDNKNHSLWSTSDTSKKGSAAGALIELFVSIFRDPCRFIRCRSFSNVRSLCRCEHPTKDENIEDTNVEYPHIVNEWLNDLVISCPIFMSFVAKRLVYFTSVEDTVVVLKNLNHYENGDEYFERCAEDDFENTECQKNNDAEFNYHRVRISSFRSPGLLRWWINSTDLFQKFSLLVNCQCLDTCDCNGSICGSVYWANKEMIRENCLDYGQRFYFYQTNFFTLANVIEELTMNPCEASVDLWKHIRDLLRDKDKIENDYRSIFIELIERIQKRIKQILILQKIYWSRQNQSEKSLDEKEEYNKIITYFCSNEFYLWQCYLIKLRYATMKKTLLRNDRKLYFNLVELYKTVEFEISVCNMYFAVCLDDTDDHEHYVITDSMRKLYYELIKIGKVEPLNRVNSFETKIVPITKYRWIKRHPSYCYCEENAFPMNEDLITEIEKRRLISERRGLTDRPMRKVIRQMRSQIDSVKSLFRSYLLISDCLSLHSTSLEKILAVFREMVSFNGTATDNANFIEQKKTLAALSSYICDQI